MRSYGEPIDVRRGLVAGQEAPEQVIWRGRLWVVREIIAHWVETGAWWEQPGATALLGADLLGERDLWRVEAGRGRFARRSTDPEGAGSHGVFDLSFDWGSGQWHLVRSID